MQAQVLQYGQDPAHPLADKLSLRENATLAAAAQTAGVPGGVRILQIMRPWLAALTLAVTPLLKAGLDPAHGVDKRLKAQALATGNPVDGLETAEPQLYQRLLVNRNHAWAQRIAAMLRKPGTVFIAVGAAHLAGPDSVQGQLRKLGIDVVRE